MKIESLLPPVVFGAWRFILLLCLTNFGFHLRFKYPSILPSRLINVA